MSDIYTHTDGFGGKWWYLNGKHHRTDGPAIEFGTGDNEFWILDKQLSFNDWLEAIPDLTYEDKVMYKLQYG
jgi:hypothetical protein|tara:strand:- start:191 stop:406 length:216 start_codon:yes stop_codon:yes gene_type:complete